jgi:hypothetical protein
MTIGDAPENVPGLIAASTLTNTQGALFSPD